MPREKDLKRLVRARMKKTGEAYTAARTHVLRKPRKNAPRPADGERLTPVANEYAALAGMSDAATHREIAALVSTTYGAPSWWTQTVTVGYERIQGLRARGQGRDGAYEATKSRTVNVPVATLFDAWADSALRRRWLGESGVKVRTTTAPKSIRLGWSDSTIVAVGFTAKSASKSAVALAHTKLPDRNAAARLKQYWAERLEALGELLMAR